jgi:predicted Ser/Thr protein kinase
MTIDPAKPSVPPPSSEGPTVPPPAIPASPSLPVGETRTFAPTTDSAPGPGSVSGPAIPPELIDHPRYRVLRLLGQGGMGAVYLAEHRKMQRLVALKVISAALVNNPETVRRFQQEVRTAAQLGNHPHVVAVHDADQAGDLHFLVMEYVEGQSLADYLRQRGPLPLAEACDYARQAALALQNAAEHGMVHRDIKPHNLMRTPQGTIKILDFGLARTVREHDRDRTQLTSQGVIMGTADYMAPEQANDSRTADIRADIYSLGCTLYHLLSGRVPFPEGGVIDKIIKHAVEAPPSLGTLRPEAPWGLVKVVEKLMAKDPAQRFQTPTEVVEALTTWTSATVSVPRGVVATPEATAQTTAAPMTVLPADSGLRSSSINRAALRAVRWPANWLMGVGFLYGLIAFPLLMVYFIFISSWSPHERDTGKLCGALAALAVAVSFLITLGAIKMKTCQSYLLAVIASCLALLPLSPCFIVTIPLGIRALLCLNDPEVKAAFERNRRSTGR